MCSTRRPCRRAPRAEEPYYVGSLELHDGGARRWGFDALLRDVRQGGHGQYIDRYRLIDGDSSRLDGHCLLEDAVTSNPLGVSLTNPFHQGGTDGIVATLRGVIEGYEFECLTYHERRTMTPCGASKHGTSTWITSAQSARSMPPAADIEVTKFRVYPSADPGLRAACAWMRRVPPVPVPNNDKDADSSLGDANVGFEGQVAGWSSPSTNRAAIVGAMTDALAAAGYLRHAALR